MQANDERFKVMMIRTQIAERGYANNPDDPGGETKYGISKRSYPDLDIPNLTWEQAENIYWRDFWVNPRIRELPDWINGAVFDFAINSSPHTAIHYLQSLLGIADDGVIGPITLASVDMVGKSEKYKEFAVTYVVNRLLFMTRLSNWKKAGHDWAVRISQQILYVIQEA